MRIDPLADPTTATIRIAGLRRPLTLLHVTDSHMVEADDRDPEAAPHLAHYTALFTERTPGQVAPRRLFEQALARGRDLAVDAVVLTGDIVHFPARAGIEAVRQGLDAVGAPWLYTLGNHDWHFPHLEWSAATRAAWYPRFADLTGGDPACQAIEVGGVRLVTLDNSTYQVDDGQVDFLRRQLDRGQPCLLFLHIPLWIPSLAPAVLARWQAPIVMGAAAGWTDEARARWRVPGNDAATLACLELLASPAAERLAGVFCGHVHFAHVDALRPGCCQYVTAPGFEGGYRLIRLEAL